MSSFAEMLSLMAKDAAVSPEKLEMVIAAVERERNHVARQQFTIAFQALQNDLPEIDENGAMFRDGKEICKYSKWEDIQRTIKPLLKQHGFTLTFSNAFPSPREIEVVAILMHVGGHHTENAFRLAADETGHKNDNQALASSQTYGMRYATIRLLNIITRGADVDQGDYQHTQALKFNELNAPEGYDKIIKSLRRAADKGELDLAKAAKKVPMHVWECLVLRDTETFHAIKNAALRIEIAEPVL